MRRFLISLVLLCPLSAYASGGTWTVFLTSASNYGGSGCTATGVLGGRTIPRCSNSADDYFYAFTEVPDFCAAAPSVTAIFDLKNVDGSTADGNVCAKIACSVLTQDADGDFADWTYNTLATTSKSLDDCDTPTGTGICVTDATDAMNFKDLSTGSDCVSSACNKRTAVCKIGRDTGASCSGDSSTSVDFIKVRLTCD